jgi:DGQHR domain-containing protein
VLFYYADSADVVDPTFTPSSDVISTTEVSAPRLQHAHEYMDTPPYDGVLVSRAIIGGAGTPGAKYSQQQRNRLYSVGIRQFLNCPPQLKTMGDSGAFTFSRLGIPPLPPADVVAFYDTLAFDYGVSVDHLVAEKRHRFDDDRVRPNSVTAKAEKSLENALEFLRVCRTTCADFTPVAAVQGWSPRSLARYAQKLADAGYEWIGLGGLVGQPIEMVYDCVAEVKAAVPQATRLHVFGLSPSHVAHVTGLGIDSFDSSSPMLRAVKDSTKNYFLSTGAYAALRIPKVVDSPRQRLPADQIEHAAALEAVALSAIRKFSQGSISVDDALASVLNYESFVFPERNSFDDYHATLEAKPWKDCTCRPCRELGIDVIIHRGMNRNKRRGFHNLQVLYSELIDMRTHGQKLRVPCIRAIQGEMPVYSFVVNGKQIQRFASVSRARRDASAQLAGYQRPEVSEHIEEIANYLTKHTAFLPNSIVIAFRGGIDFSVTTPFSATVALGHLDIDVRDDERHGWIVDGQQRVAALRSLSGKDLPVSVVAFVSDSDREEREQFVLVNNTRPLPKSLVFEMLPEIDAVPPRLRRRKNAYAVLEVLNTDDGSPFKGRIVTATSLKAENTNIKDVSVLRMIENSFRDGLLMDVESQAGIAGGRLRDYWSVVRESFPDAWDAQPKKSRLTHGAGIVSMGYLMDAICLRKGRTPAKSDYAQAVSGLGKLPWMAGFWPFSTDLQLPWNEIQNTGRHIDLLTNHLIRQYRKAS